MPRKKTKQLGITKDMTMGDILNKNPEAADVMLGYGLHCVGCGINEYDTIEQGAVIHGMSPEEIASLMDDLNNMVATPGVQTQQGIAITSQALRKIKELQLLEEKQGWPLQVEFLTQPNAEKEFFLEFIERPQPNQTAVTFGSVTLLFAQESLEDVKGLTIDYVQNENEEGFQFREQKQ